MITKVIPKEDLNGILRIMVYQLSILSGEEWKDEPESCVLKGEDSFFDYKNDSLSLTCHFYFVILCLCHWHL